MPLYGDLRTLSLEDLLRWAAANQKTGVLEVGRNAIYKWVEFRKGWVGSCSSNEPSSLLGQFLLSRGKINESQLQNLLTLRKATRKRLGLLLVEMNVLTRNELANEIAAKAQETIHSLFDWEDAFFRFDEGATLDPDQIEVNLSVDEMIVEGKKRAEELREIRKVFESSGAVLTRSGNDAPAELLERPSTRRIIDAIDGQRTIAEILVYARLSQFRVLQLLYRLYGRGLLHIRETRPVPPETESLLEIPPRRPVEDRPWARTDGEIERGDAEGQLDLDVVIEKALQMIERMEFEGAVQLLRGVCRDHANDYAHRLLSKAESGFLSSFKEDETFVSQVPVLLKDRRESLAEDVRPADSFLLTMIDGTTDVQSILWLTPLREIEVLTALQRMTDSGVIGLRPPETVVSVELSAPFGSAS